MNEISCDICMDLIPLVKDGIASEDSQRAVEQHIKTCEACRSFYHNEALPAANTEQAFFRFRRQIQIFSAMLLMFGIFFGVSLTAGVDMFYNSLLMPVIGALGYILFRWKAGYLVPMLILVTHSATNFLGLLRGTEHMDIYSLLMWTVLYSLFAAVGTLIAGLLHFAFRKEK